VVAATTNRWSGRCWRPEATSDGPRCRALHAKPPGSARGSHGRRNGRARDRDRPERVAIPERARHSGSHHAVQSSPSTGRERHLGLGTAAVRTGLSPLERRSAQEPNRQRRTCGWE
jgi:hypothetical protein